MTTTSRKYDLVDAPTRRRPRKPIAERKAPFVIKGWVWRVVWKREGWNQKSKTFHTETRALKHFHMMGPAPWRYFTEDGGPIAFEGKNPDRVWCCSHCGNSREELIEQAEIRDGVRTAWVQHRPCPKCLGARTVRELIERKRASWPPLEWVRVERRPLGPWEGVEVEWVEDSDQNGETTNPPVSSAARFLAESLREAITRAEETFATPAPITDPRRLLPMTCLTTLWYYASLYGEESTRAILNAKALDREIEEANQWQVYAGNVL